MPTFTAIALDSLIEPRSSKTMVTGKHDPDPKPEKRINAPSASLQRGTSMPTSKPGMGIGIPRPRVERRNSVSMTKVDKKHHWPRISPALYATPESTPLPDSPSSFPPSPYIINHKRRGPRLLKSFSEDDVATRERALDEEKATENTKNEERDRVTSDKDIGFTFNVPTPVEDDHAYGVSDGEHVSSEMSNGLPAHNGSMDSVKVNGQRDAGPEDFFDPQDSESVKSNAEGEGAGGVEQSLNLTTPMAEFYDAREELLSESGPQPPLIDVEAECREIRLSLLMEIEKRKQAEESLNTMQSYWLEIQQQLSLVGLTLPAEDEQVDDPAEELCRQVYLSRFVSNSIGRGTAKAEVEEEMEAQLEAKNFEIARLWDRLNYYEAVNREMSQRNQEEVEIARQLRQRRNRRQSWIWGSVAAAITIGTAALAWSYLPTGKGSSSSNQSHAPESVQSSK